MLRIVQLNGCSRCENAAMFPGIPTVMPGMDGSLKPPSLTCLHPRLHVTVESPTYGYRLAVCSPYNRHVLRPPPSTTL
jgi:hypothetical protein